MVSHQRSTEHGHTISISDLPTIWQCRSNPKAASPQITHLRHPKNMSRWSSSLVNAALSESSDIVSVERMGSADGCAVGYRFSCEIRSLGGDAMAVSHSSSWDVIGTQ